MAENIKEFFHNNGIHSTTIQPEFVDCNGYIEDRNSVGDDDCAIGCPRDPEKLAPNCQASKCCPAPSSTKESSKSEQNTPTRRRRNSLACESPEALGEVQILMPGGSNPEIATSSLT